MQTIKQMLKKSQDPHLAVLSYRATPHPWCGLSPAELCMGRSIRTTVPQTVTMFKPQWSYLVELKQKNAQFKAGQKAQFDRRHQVKELVPIRDDSEVWIASEGQPIPVRLVSTGDTPRSYVVATESGLLRRNRGQINVVPEPASNKSSESSESSESVESS